ncbi:excalibur calcium-binding domain-containing protein [Streptomyces tibetensis]|uniref:Excalibur calcium-binding domain-containing protein n=1 Tax=Streptomyces tibetensis TaxID=2382123 RepID=A0ABW6MUM9_9ACTN
MTSIVTVEPPTSTPESLTPTPEPTTSAPESRRPTAPSPAADASSVVREYFAAINAQDYRRAWDLGGKNLSGSYGAFVDGFATTAHDTAHILRVDGGTVSVSFEAAQTDGSLRVFEGTYTVHAGTIVGADIGEVTGPEPQPSEASPSYENCDAARAAGAAPIHQGEPGYAPHLDRDGDGVACEPYPP